MTGVTCEYCGATLLLDPGRITRQRAAAARPRPVEATSEGGPALEQPDPTLSVRESARFSMRVIEQPAGSPASGESADLFTSLELGDDRFAIASLQCVDGDDGPLPLPMGGALAVLEESLGDDGDPGLAVNLFLEEISRHPRFKKLRAAVCVIDPRRTTATVYSAGVRSGLMWVSTEEGRPITAGPSHSALEKLDLAKRGNQFDNGKVIQMAALDLLVVPSFGFLYDPALGMEGGRALTEVLRENFADEPERIVTLVKNAWWEARAKRRGADAPLSGDLVVAAVGARLAEPEEGALEDLRVELLSTDRFDVAVQRRPGDFVLLAEVEAGKRHVLIRARATGEVILDAANFDALAAATLAVHAERGHGNFDNPRAAGRAGLAAIGRDDIDLIVCHLSDEHGRTKYFVNCTKLAPAIGARAVRPDHEQQQFDSGGEVTLPEHARILFPGTAPYEGEVLRGDHLAEVWYGGKASHLMEALRLAWRTRRADRALGKIARAMAADAGRDAVQGLALVQGK